MSEGKEGEVKKKEEVKREEKRAENGKSKVRYLRTSIRKEG